MKKTIKIILLIVAIFFLFLMSFITYSLIVVSNAKLDKDKLINMERIITYYDKYGKKFAEESGGIAVTDLDKMPDHVKNAFIAIEDKRFYTHSGIDTKGLFRALFNNLKSFSFKEGASTISQQLIKNTHLSNEKTLKRKFIEIKLTKELEKTYSKDEILEKYLNTIYFGSGCYGITNASRFYFNKSPENLSVNESATLAAIIKAPTHYSPITNYDQCISRKTIVLNAMYEQGYIDKETLDKCKNTKVIIENINTIDNNNYKTIARKELNDLIKNYPYSYKNLKVFTNFDPEIQAILESEKFISKEYDNSSIIMDKNSRIVAYTSTCKMANREPGSTIKPLLVYAPAIELDAVYSCSPILDEKINFNGYSPSNYNDKYYGYISVKESLSKSSNCCAVKLLNYVGVDKAKSFIENTDIKLDKNDNSLCIALGALSNGINIVDLTSAYCIFLNQGKFNSASCINKITNEKMNIIYKTQLSNKKIFSPESIDIVNDMLSYTVANGTAKKLLSTNLPLYAKTGTVGNKNGNTDAYTVSFTSEYILTSWCGSKEHQIMSNSITGGNLPARQSSMIWNKIYSNYTPKEISRSNNVCEEFIDKISYDENHTVKLADINAPMRYKELALFKKNKIPKERATVFSLPEIEKPKISVNNNEIKMTLCLPQLYDALIFKSYNNKKIAVYDTANQNKKIFIDNKITPGVKYEYFIVPYYDNNGSPIFGKEIYLGAYKISPTALDWWKNELD